MYKALLKFFCCFISFCIILFFISIYVIARQITNVYSVNGYNRYQFDTLARCEPLKRDSVNEIFEIEGEPYPKLVGSFHNKSINFDCLNSDDAIKTIFLWNFDNSWHKLKYGELGRKLPFITKKCPVVNCELTNEPSKLAESHIVLFNLENLNKLPKIRSKFTRWVAFISKPLVYHPKYAVLNSLFNQTATYAFDSDYNSLYYSNIMFDWGLNDEYKSNYNYLKFKSKFGAVYLAECFGDGDMVTVNYIKEMQKYASIDVYGDCEKFFNITKCKQLNSNGNKNCKDYIYKKYKFILTFEKQMCNEFISDEFFYAISNNIVPIVLGYGDYSKFVPKSSYINALDFSSPLDLMKYLNYLELNSTAYNAYFKWKKFARYTNTEYKIFCDMCIKLHLDTYFGIESSIVKNLDKYWINKINCQNTI